MKPFFPVLALLFTLPSFAGSIPPKYLKFLEKMVNINTGTGNFQGANEVRALIRSELIALGFKEQKRGNPKGHQVVAYERNHATPKKVMLYGHIDTVFAKESPFKKIRFDGDKIYGPGVIDMKGGIVMILNLISDLKTRPDILDQIRVVFGDDEETSSRFGTPHLDEFATGVPYGLIFEPGLKDGATVVSHSGVHWIELLVKGKAAHAGAAHKEGVNACVELGEKIHRISQLTDYRIGLTFSPDVIQGGTKANIVCESASAQIDIRFIRNEDLKKGLDEISEILKHKTVKSESSGEQASFELKSTAHFSSLESKSTEKVFGMAKTVAKNHGVDFKGGHAGYGTDGGHFAELGMKVLVGVGPYGDGMHTDHEYMWVPSYQERIQLNRDLIESLIKSEI